MSVSDVKYIAQNLCYKSKQSLKEFNQVMDDPDCNVIWGEREAEKVRVMLDAAEMLMEFVKKWEGRMLRKRLIIKKVPLPIPLVHRGKVAS